MQTTVKPGKYVIAVSGGVDSMVLLDLLYVRPGIDLIVAHLDHGIRQDSGEDRLLVEATAKKYKLPFEYKEAKLGPGASEAEARVVRYAFLEAVRKSHHAQAIITAHHQDDVLETAILNMLRGTGRKGLSSLKSSDTIIRPLLAIPKREVRTYAEENGVQWREDSTNQDECYLRNFVRRQLLTKLSNNQKQELADRLLKAAAINEEIDALLLQEIQSHISDEGLSRQWFVGLPYDVSAEVMAAWLREAGIREFDRKTIARLVVAAKISLAGKCVDITAGNQLRIGKYYLRIARR